MPALGRGNERAGILIIALAILGLALLIVWLNDRNKAPADGSGRRNNSGSNLLGIFAITALLLSAVVFGKAQWLLYAGALIFATVVCAVGWLLWKHSFSKPARRARRAHGGEVDAVIAELEREIAERGPSATLFCELGRCRILKQEYSLALPLLRKAHELSPKSQSHRSDLALVLLQLGLCDEAEPLYAELTRGESQNPFDYSSHASALAGLGRFNEAEAMLTRAEDVLRETKLVGDTRDFFASSIEHVRAQVARLRAEKPAKGVLDEL